MGVFKRHWCEVLNVFSSSRLFGGYGLKKNDDGLDGFYASAAWLRGVFR